MHPDPPSPWPAADTPEAAAAFLRDDAALRPGVDAICAANGLACLPITRFAAGSLPVYAIGTERVLKVYPPPWSHEQRREALVLSVLGGRLPIPTPALIVTGDLAGWTWCLMVQLHGASLAARWSALDDRAAVAAAVGRCLAALHAVDDPRLADLDREGIEGEDPAAFLDVQRRTAVDRQRARGLDDAWLDQISGFLERNPVPAGPPVLLHTELMRDHLLVDVASDRLTGLFDFEPSMLGPAEYELSSVGLFVTGGDPRLFRILLLAYGLQPADLGPEFERRILACALLHRYSNFPWYLRRVPPPPGTATLEDLARAWFGT